MDGYSNHLPAQDSTTIGGQYLALIGGAAGSLLFLLALIIYVFLKRCDCTMTFRMRSGDASIRPVEEAWWNKEVGYCNYNKLAYTHTHTYQRTSSWMKWCLIFLLRMTCLAALPCENGKWQFEEASTLMFFFFFFFFFFRVRLKNLIEFLSLSLSLSLSLVSLIFF